MRGVWFLKWGLRAKRAGADDGTDKMIMMSFRPLRLSDVVLYHATPAEYVDSICMHGLLAGVSRPQHSNQMESGYRFLAMERRGAEDHSKNGRFVILEFKYSGLVAEFTGKPGRFERKMGAECLATYQEYDAVLFVEGCNTELMFRADRPLLKPIRWLP